MSCTTTASGRARPPRARRRGPGPAGARSPRARAAARRRRRTRARPARAGRAPRRRSSTLGAELLDDRGQARRTRRDHLAGQHVGVDDDRPQLGQGSRDRALARRDAAGQSHAHRHAGIIPAASVSWVGPRQEPGSSPSSGSTRGWQDRGVDLPPGSRVALLVPGSVAYVDLVIALLAAGSVPGPAGPAADRRASASLLADLDPQLVVEHPAGAGAARSCRQHAGRPAGPAAGPPDARHQRHHRDARRASGRGLLDARAGRGAGRRGARAVGLRAPTTSTWCSARSTTPRRCGSRSARCSPAAGSWCPGPSTRPA